MPACNSAEMSAFTINSDLGAVVAKFEIGSSISCSGACLTLEKYRKNLSQFYISKETLSKTIFQSSKKGDIINLIIEIFLTNL